MTTIKNQIRLDRIPHAYLFCGSRGTGKTSTARVLARAVNCTDLQDGEPCGRCPQCQSIEQENCLDVIEIDAASHTSVEGVRELIDNISFPPVMCRRKVYIIDEVHMLSASAFNALLKTLEEPPEYALFILATTEPQKLPATILSRCQRYDFGRIPASVIVDQLRDVTDGLGLEADEAALHDLAMAAEGGMRDALSLMDMCLSYEGARLTEQTVRAVLGTSDRSFLFSFVQALIDGDTAKAFSQIDELMRTGRDPAIFAREVTSHVRALMVAQLGGEGLDAMLGLTREDAQRLITQAKDAQSARLARLMDMFMQAGSDMRQSSQPRAVLELCAVRACHPEREAGDEAIEDRIETLERTIRKGEEGEASIENRLSALEKAVESGVQVAAPKGAKAEKAREKAPSPEEKATVAPDAEAAWQAGLKAISREDPRTWTLMNKGRFGGVTDDVVHLVYKPEGADTFIKLLSGAERAAFIDEQMSAAFGRAVHVQAHVPDAFPPRETAPEGRKNIDKVYDVFPRDMIELTD